MQRICYNLGMSDRFRCKNIEITMKQSIQNKTTNQNYDTPIDYLICYYLL